MLYGNESANPPSRFIKEISDEYLDKDIIKRKDVKSRIIDNVNSNEEYHIGDKINHAEFGEGIIVSVDKTILTIAFPHPYGIKKIMRGHKSICKVGGKNV